MTETDELPNVDLNVDYETILPIQQKRTITFINNFLTNTLSFFNTFSQSCESRLIEFNYKIQKLEAALLILESQLSSIPDNGQASQEKVYQRSQDVELPEVIESAEVNSEEKEVHHSPDSLDPQYSIFFKMVHVGVPLQAVKNKMVGQGLDPSILESRGGLT
ncbi:Subunit CCDC53 of WASH complex [Popillia japonica]|uniref:Subunit CCDC53 of WASH complex n=1 Tax=Popillia japonica TaxID=7064 RepID=A0AAW1N4S0_POPJA